MLKNEDVICISSIDWDFIWQGHQEIMTQLARAENRVLFIENTGVRVPAIKDFERIKNRIKNWKAGLHGIRKIENRLYVYSPLVLPFPYLKIARFINKRLVLSVLAKWLRAIGITEPVVWVFLPTGLSLDLIDAIEPKVLIYYCIDSFQASSPAARKITHTEKQVLKRCDLVFATSQELFDYCARYNKNVYYFPFGVNIDNFVDVLDRSNTVPPDMKDIKRPIIGYIGGIHKWIDFDLVRHLADRNRDASFVFCGPIQTDISMLKDLANVIFLGQKDTRAIPAYVKEFDIALIPYKIMEYTRNVYPTKLNEYLSLGKPVISINLPEIIKFNSENMDLVTIATDKESFNDHIRRMLNCPVREEYKKFAMDAARKNSWEGRIEEMSELIENLIKEKISEREKSWKRNISMIYRKARKKFVPAVILFAIIYMVLFHTPLIWILAEPLHSSDAPQKADVIAALGGGVGESGRVGQGYQERVISAVKLYKEGYAEKIIYFSGYKYKIKEAQVMKALSVFMGVKESDILLDDASATTYDMIMNLKNFMLKNEWKNVILVSSPYHMLRLRLLCAKHLKGTKVLLLPVEESSFYIHESGTKLNHIRGILQEYLAILYYKLKAYL